MRLLCRKESPGTRPRVGHARARVRSSGARSRFCARPADTAHGPGGTQPAGERQDAAADQAARLQGTRAARSCILVRANARFCARCAHAAAVLLARQANLTKLKGDVKKASAALVDVEAARDELLSRAELGALCSLGVRCAALACSNAAAAQPAAACPTLTPSALPCSAGDTAGGAATSAAQRDRLLNATDKLKQTGDRIKEGKKTLLETEELGVSILQDLHKQRETIQHTRDTVRARASARAHICKPSSGSEQRSRAAEAETVRSGPRNAPLTRHSHCHAPLHCSCTARTRTSGAAAAF